MEMGYWALRPVARGCIALGADARTRSSWASLALAGCRGRLRSRTGTSAWARPSALVSSLCDALDGMVARETGTASDSGEVLDAAVDRYAELFFLGGVALYERVEPVALASRARARRRARSW